MKKLNVLIDWCGRNYTAIISENVGGVVVVTNKSYEGLFTAIDESVQEQVKDNEAVPDWVREGHYEYELSHTLSATLQRALAYTTLAAISRVTGIKHAQLSRYANGLSRPKQKQEERVMRGLRTIGDNCIAIAG